MTPEGVLQRTAHLVASKIGARLFRNNVGLGWAGKIKSKEGGTVTLTNARPLHAGLIEGSSDLIGWLTVTVTPEMVGRKIAVFCSPEIKTETGPILATQETWIENIQKAGGIAGFIRSDDDMTALLTGFIGVV